MIVKTKPRQTAFILLIKNDNNNKLVSINILTGNSAGAYLCVFFGCFVLLRYSKMK